ncbi:alginate export family protein [Fulvivirgaceae bacterium BMA10]|uniref:Alginate export family protein n=1 Tax=Splendidivirga corallicola TaxID=3051826 RepID=A0ABT8KQ24_9BACT|nr:alginate export family protein [Fulvivirgaceae bacterium BMA10]
MYKGAVRFFITTIAVTGLALSSYAQFTISGEFRPRAEYRHGYRALADEDQDAAFFIDQRTRLNLLYNNERFTMKVVLQDVRTWGSVSQLVVEDGAKTTLHEAWGQVKLNEQWAIKLGRQEIVYDDSRILGSVAWAQQARSHDALILKYMGQELGVDLGLAFNQNGPQLNSTFYSVPNNYKALQYLRVHKKFNNTNASLLFLNNGRQGGTPTDANTYFSQTAGIFFKHLNGSLRPEGSLYYQFGDEADGVTEISALQYKLSLDYLLSDKVTITGGFEHLSGNSQTNPDSKNKAFNPFYGTNHMHNGLIDYFYVGNHINSVGLEDIFLKLKLNTGKGIFLPQLHFFSANGEVMDDATTNGMDKYLGTELDLVFSKALAKDMNLQIGYSQMFGTDVLEQLQSVSNRATSNWAWVMLTLKPTFFTTKKPNTDAN